MKISKFILFVLFFSTVVLCNRTFAKSFDSGIPMPKEYTKEIVSAYIGQKVTVTYINYNVEDNITVIVLGVLWDRFEKGERYFLLGKTMFKTRIVIPIEKIKVIK